MRRGRGHKVNDMEKRQITEEVVDTFLHGRDPMERIVDIECGYRDDRAHVIFRDINGVKRVMLDDFKPFVWAKVDACLRLFDGDRTRLQRELKRAGIRAIGLTTHFGDEPETERMSNGFKVMFQAERRMCYQDFLAFFRKAGVPLYKDEKQKSGSPPDSSDKEYLVLTPVEQYMIATGKRLFKGYEGYDELLRMTFDLETQGLNPRLHGIEWIGIRTNQGFERVIRVDQSAPDAKARELEAIREMFRLVADIEPDVITGHNTETFDWNFIIVRLTVLGSSIEAESVSFLPEPIYKKKRPTVLKLGGEVEYYHQTVIWGINVTDSLHAVRRAQAIDSNMKKADLKYVSKYSRINKPNRVYVKGGEITKVLNDTEGRYAFNDKNGHWHKITEEQPLKEGEETVTGEYVVRRYLLDDLYEGDKVEMRYNESNFLICKMIPTSFTRACTMGTAAIWKLIMLAWSYENRLAVPDFGKKTKFTGGLSRLLKVGAVDNLAKLDYNSLYPSIILTWEIKTGLDLEGIMLYILEYVLTNREKYKGLKGKAGKEAGKVKEEMKKHEAGEAILAELALLLQRWESEESANDKKQLPLKIFGNSFFGSYGSPDLFNWGDLVCAEKTTCIGRQCLRLMISWFTNLGYEPVVGDSFTGDTPLFVKGDDDGMIDIVPIRELMDEDKVETDALGREYDRSVKPYKVLCRSGWVRPEYVYRHKTDKMIWRVEDGNSVSDVTEDHSLFNDAGTKLTPNLLTPSMSLEYYRGAVKAPECARLTDSQARMMAVQVAYNKRDRVPKEVLNGTRRAQNIFLDTFIAHTRGEELTVETRSKTLLAGINFLLNTLDNWNHED